MKYRSSEETIKKILTAIAENIEFAQYDLPKKIDKNYRKILRYVHCLEHRGLIQLSRTERSKKKGKDRKIYSLTIFGLIALLKIIAKLKPEEFKKKIDELAGKYETMLPLLFGKWSFFENNNLKETILNRLEKTLQSEYSYLIMLLLSKVPIGKPKRIPAENYQKYFEELLVDRNHSAGDKKIMIEQIQIIKKEFAKFDSIDREFIEYDFTRKIIFDFNGINFNDKQKFEEYLRIISKDHELNLFISESFKIAEEKYAIMLANVQSWHEFWKNLWN